MKVHNERLSPYESFSLTILLIFMDVDYRCLIGGTMKRRNSAVFREFRRREV